MVCFAFPFLSAYVIFVLCFALIQSNPLNSEFFFFFFKGLGVFFFFFFFCVGFGVLVQVLVLPVLL